MVSPRVILLLLSALPLAARGQSGISPCLVPTKGWYTVCQPDAKAGGYTCLVSSAWCAPYNQPQYFLSGSTGHRPGPGDRLRILLDPWSRNSTSANVCNEDVDKCMADILAGKETIGSPVVEKYHVSFVVTSLSYFDLTVPDYYISVPEYNICSKRAPPLSTATLETAPIRSTCPSAPGSQRRCSARQCPGRWPVDSDGLSSRSPMPQY